MGQCERHQHDGNRIQCGEHGHGHLDDHAESGVGHHETEHGEQCLPCAIAHAATGDGGESRVEVCGARADQTRADIQTGDDEHDAQKYHAERAEQRGREIGEYGRACIGRWIDRGNAPGHDTHIAEHRIDHDQQDPGAETGVCGLPTNKRVVGDMHGADVRRNHDAEVQSS